MLVVTDESSRMRSTLPKKCALSRTIGPPSTPPNCCCLDGASSSPSFFAKYSSDDSFSSWKNTNAAPRRLVGARLRHRVDDAAGGQPVLGVELAAQQLELLHRFDRHARLRAAVAAVERVVVVRPVHRVVDVADVLAGDADRVGAERRRRNRRHHAGQHAEIAGEVAVERRRIDELLRADAAADLLRRGVDQRRLRRHGDRLGQPADFELELDLRGAADFEPHVALRILLEAGQFGGDFIDARRHPAHQERAVGAADRFAEQPALLMPHDDRDARQHARPAGRRPDRGDPRCPAARRQEP